MANVVITPIAPRTVIEAFLPSRGSVGLDQVYAVGNAAGVADQPLRLAIRRMVAAGEIRQTGRGRNGAMELTDAGRERLDHDRLGLQLAFAQDHGRAPWDRQWRLLAISAPESERTIRDALRRRLTELGAAAISTGLYLSPHDLTGLLPDLDPSHLVQATASELNLRGSTDAHAQAEELWPAVPIMAGYAVLERLLPDLEDQLPATAEIVLVQQLRLADALERALRTDPLIPLELRAEPWPPSRLRRRARQAWVTLSGLLPEELLYRGWLQD